MLGNTETDQKFSRLQKYLPLLTLAPYTRAIFLAGSVAAGNPQPESDIDLMMVSQKNRLWLNKFFLEILTKILGIKRTGKTRRDKICFNMFLAHSAPLLPHRDETAAACYKNLKPVWGGKKDIEKFWETNLWIEKFYPSRSDLPGRSDLIENFPKSESVKNFLEKFLEFFRLAPMLEKISYRLQLSYLAKKFDLAVADKNSGAYDLWVRPNLIAYHFPISNHHLAVEKSRRTAKNNLVRSL